MNVPIEKPLAKPLKLGLKIEKPSEEKLHPFFLTLLVISGCLIAMTFWMLVLEYFGEPLPEWLQFFLDNFVAIH